MKKIVVVAVELGSVRKRRRRGTSLCRGVRNHYDRDARPRMDTTAAAASGLILRSYGFMALVRGRWPSLAPSLLPFPPSDPRWDSRSCKSQESSPWRWWNAGRANRGRPALAPRSHAFLPAPLALLLAFSSSLGLPLPFSLFLSISSSALSSSRPPYLSLSLLLSRSDTAPHYYALGRFISFLSSLSLSLSLSFVLVYTRTYDTHAPQTKILPLRFSLSLFLLPLSHLSPFLSFSDSSLCLPHGRTREFADLSLSFFSSALPPPSPFSSRSPRYSISLAYARVHIHMCTHDSYTR